MPRSPRGAATATVRLADGRVFSTTVLHPKGSQQKPLTDQELEAKLRDNARHGGFGGPVDGLIAALWRVDALATVDTLVAACGAAA